MFFNVPRLIIICFFVVRVFLIYLAVCRVEVNRPLSQGAYSLKFNMQEAVKDRSGQTGRHCIWKGNEWLFEKVQGKGGF